MQSAKLLEDNTGENLDDLGIGDDFLDTTAKAWSMKEIIDKLDFIKIKNFCSVKYTVKRMKTINHGLGENICKRHIWKRNGIQNTWKTLKTQQLESKFSFKKGKRSEQTSDQTKNTYSK